MIELLWLAFIITAAGTMAAGIWDLKTTEVPDEISAILAALGIFIWFVFGATTGNFVPLALAAAFGAGLLLFGWALYKLGGWGGGDAKIFAAMFCILPLVGLFLDFIFNFFIVAVIYIILYVLIISLANKKIFSYWAKSIKSSALKMAGLSILALALISLAVAAVFDPFFISITILVIIIDAMILFFTLAKVVEKKLFKQTVPASKLKLGDVLASSKQWIGIEKEQLAKLQKSGKPVQIKEGIRFTMVFPITLIITWFFGNVMFLFIQALVVG